MLQASTAWSCYGDAAMPTVYPFITDRMDGTYTLLIHQHVVLQHQGDTMYTDLNYDE